jgi:predicted enzyme related to lactoylglutathione lyase
MDMGDGGTYWLAKVDGAPAGGIFPMAGPQFDGIPEHWLSYIAVDDVDASAKRAEAEGGTIRRPAFDVPGVGRIVILEDPGGAAMGWMTPAD